MPAEIDLYYSFRSPYSYLALGQLEELNAKWDVVIKFRPVLPLILRQADFFDQVNPMWVKYLMMDIVRVGDFNGTPLVWPQPDPVNLETDFDPEGDGRPRQTVDPDQSRILRLYYTSLIAEEQGRGFEFTCAIAPAYWRGHKGWDQGDHLAQAVAPLGFDFAAMSEEGFGRAAEFDAVIAANQDALEAAGHWGVPTMVYQGEPFFGQDRVSLLEWRLEQTGAAKR